MLKYLGFGLTVAGGLALMLLRPAAALSASAQLLLGGVVIVLGLWIFRPFSLPLSVGGFALAGFALAIGLPAEMVFSGMTQSAVWTLAGALFFGCALQKTGLGRRIALGVLRIFRPSYGALAAAWTLTGLLVPLLRPVAGNPWLFVAAVTAVLFLWHLVDVASFMPTLSLVPAMLPTVREVFGIDPLVFVPILSLAAISFVLAYQNIWALMAQSAAGRQVWTAKQLAVYGLCYFAAALAALLACVPLWQHWGWFG